MTELQRLLYRELYRKSFYEFVKAFWETCDPAKFIDGRLIQFYCECFQYKCKPWIGYHKVDIKLPTLEDDDEIIDIRTDKMNVNINVPPRHTKSMIFNVFGPVWLWLTTPIKAASISHTNGLASSMNAKRIKILNSEKFRYFFQDEVWLSTNARGTLVDTRGGELYSMPRETMTGFGADIIINDDLTNAETARRDQAEMASAWAYYQNTLPSRFNDRNHYLNFNIQQRLAPNDITGHILSDPKLAAMYDFIVLPAIFSKRTYLVCPISGDILKFDKGDALWPERFGDYKDLRDSVGETIFETQYLQNPIASDRTVIKDSMMNVVDLTETPGIDNADIVYASHDFPVKDKDTSDFLGSMLAYKVGSNLYIIDSLEKKMAFKASVQYVTALDTMYPGIIQVIEDKANGSPILQQLQDEVAGMQAFSPGTASKMQRLESASLYMPNIYFVRTVWNKLTQKYELSEALQNLMTRLKDFPFVEHDDIVDAFSMMILFVYMDRRYMVYGRAFNDANIIKRPLDNLSYSTIFFNKEGDVWKVAEIAVQYGVTTNIIVTRETRFKASVEDGLVKLKAFGNGKNVFIDCSATEALQGMYSKQVSIERYEISDFDKSVTQTNLAFSKKQIKLYDNCKLTKADIENFKFSKSKDDNVRYVTTKDGFVACIRIALHYYGGIV